MSERPRIAVVGGGLAGITAALDCAAGGADVTLLEVRPRLGGAAYSVERDGLVLDNGQHVFLRCCTAYRGLLDRLGVSDRVILQDRLDIPVLAPGRAPVRLQRTGLPAPLHLGRSLLRYDLLSARARAGVVRAMAALRRVDPDDPANDARSFGDWLAEHGQGPAAIEVIWRLICVPTINLEPAEASLAQAAQVFRVGLLEDASAGDVGWARVPLSQLHDGPARAALAAAGVDVRLGGRVSQVVRSGAGFELQGQDGPVAADAVVVALPPHRVGGVLPEGAVEDPGAFERLGHAPILNVFVEYDRKVLDEPFAVAVHSPASWMFDRTESTGVTSGQLVALSVSAADAEAADAVDDLRERLLPALAAVLPAARDAKVQRFLVTREHYATFRAAPGARALRPSAATRIPGLALAGTWTDTGWPATMEGAVRSGHAAAGEVLAAVRRRPDTAELPTEVAA
jgi:hydroxysqualene dehydroxylase